MGKKRPRSRSEVRVAIEERIQASIDKSLEKGVLMDQDYKNFLKDVGAKYDGDSRGCGDDDGEADRDYMIFLANAKRDGTSYVFRTADRDGFPMILKYENEAGTSDENLEPSDLDSGEIDRILRQRVTERNFSQKCGREYKDFAKRKQSRAAKTAASKQPSRDAKTAARKQPSRDAKTAARKQPSRDAKTAARKQPSRDVKTAARKQPSRDVKSAARKQPSRDVKTAARNQQNNVKTAAPNQQNNVKTAAPNQQNNVETAARKQQNNVKTAARKQQSNVKTAARKQQSNVKTAARKQQNTRRDSIIMDKEGNKESDEDYDDEMYSLLVRNLVSEDQCLKASLGNGQYLVYEACEDEDPWGEVEIIQNIKAEFDEGVSCNPFVPSVQHHVEGPSHAANLYRKNVLNFLKRPYDEEEYKKLWADVRIQKPVEKSSDLPRGENEIGKSYLDHYKGVNRKLKEANHNKDKKLNILRGFFFWLQNVTQPDAFQPWEDAECLRVKPGSS